ncbi:MAG: beta-lactamase family protein [Gemmatimonadaceae bacterium]|nr:beta-lactamase family protein [Gemmatimonadaceae bacterium]
MRASFLPRILPSALRLALFLVPTAATVTAPAAATAQAPLSADSRARIDAVFARWDRTDSPGCSLAISQNAREVYARGYGMSDLQHAIAITPQSIFHVASISKQFAAYSVALLAEDGRLTLDDDIRKFIPEIPDYGTTITIRHLIHHTSGLRDQWQLLGYAGWRFPEDLITEQDVMRIVTRQKGTNFKPGAEWVYSNTGYTLLAVIVKRVSGKSLREFAQERIFEPLGMTSTHFHDDHAMIVLGRTSAYEPRRDGGWKISIPVFDTYGATSLFTTAGDLLKWMANLDSPMVGSKSLVAAAQTSATLNDGTPANYGYGLSVLTYRGLSAVGHGGADAGYRAQVERYPGRGIAIAVLCNAASAVPNALLRNVADVLLGSSAPSAVAMVDTVERPISAELRQRWVGTYRDTISQSVLRIRLDGETIKLADGRTLTPTSDTTLRLGPGALVLRSSGANTVGVTQLPRSTRELFYRKEAPFTADSATLASFAGSYYSQELDVRYDLSVKDSTLAVFNRKLDGASMVPAFRDGFVANFGATVQFTRNKAGMVSGFTLADGRVRGVRFERLP